METKHIDKALEKISSAVLASINYNCHPFDELDSITTLIDTIISDESNLKACENHFKARGDDNVLYYLSNILYNLKTKSDLVLTPEVLKWMGSVWKNFINRNRSYQEFLPVFDQFTLLLHKYYPGRGNFVNQIDNVHLVKEDFIDSDGEDNSKIKELEFFCQQASDIINTMRPTYFFLLDYYYEKRLKTGIDSQDASVLEGIGLGGFGYGRYTYLNITIRTCQALGILEAVYLTLKKKRLNKQIISIDGKKKLLSTPEIYNFYLNKFNQLKKELITITK